MFILKGIDQLTNAIAKAKKVRPRVEFDHFGRYRVSGSKGYYTVICKRSDNGIKRLNALVKALKRLGLLSRCCRFKFAYRISQTATASGIKAKGLDSANCLSLSFKPRMI